MNAPKLRFKEFNSQWAIDIMGNYVDVQTGPFGSQLHEKDYVKEGTPIITVEHFGDNRVIHKNLPLVSDEDKLRLKKYSLSKGDIVFSRVGSVDRRVLISEMEDGWLFSGRCLRLRTSSRKLDSLYLSYLIGTNKCLNEIKSKAVGGTMPSLNTEILNSITIQIPSIDEQHKIGSFLSILDKKIQLQQEKIDLLKKQKKGFMQKMFNQELRFKNEDGQEFPAWENKLIGEIGDIIMGQSPDGSSYSEDSSDTVLVQGNADLKNGNIVPRIYTSQVTKMCSIGDIILTVRAPVGVVAKSNIPACIGRGVCAIRSDYFLFYYLDYYYITSQWAKLSQGSTFESINSTDIKNITVPQPSNPEKKLIIAFFDMLSKKIELAENNLNELESQKQAFMQQMFI